MANLLNELTKGIWKENPLLVILLGLCPTLAVTTSAINGLGMGVATLFVLVCSNIAVAAIRKVTPGDVRIPVFIVVIATFVTIIDLVMQAYTPELSKALGIFIPLIVVNCIILGRAEAFAAKNGVAASTADGIGMGIGFTLALVILGSFREVLGNGSIFGKTLFGPDFQPMLTMVLAPGAFIALGFVLAIMNKINASKG